MENPHSIDLLQANPLNPRLPFTTDQLDAFEASLLRFGDLGGIVRNIRSDQLVGGHKRVESFKRADPATVSVQILVKLDTPDACGTVGFGFVHFGGTRHAYREVDWDESTEAAANLAANQFGAEFDWEGVSAMLKRIDTTKVDLKMTGFPAHELENLLKAAWAPPAAGNMPTNNSGKIDPVHLTSAGRVLLDKIKVALLEPDDALAIEKVLTAYLDDQPLGPMPAYPERKTASTEAVEAAQGEGEKGEAQSLALAGSAGT